MNSHEMERRVKMVANKTRCKHGMIFEYCGECQRVEEEHDTYFPIPKTDADGNVILDSKGKPKNNWFPVTVNRVKYYRYR